MKLYSPALAMLFLAQSYSVADPLFPPTLPEGKTLISLSGSQLLQRPSNLRDEVTIAATAPTVDVMYYPGQDYPGNPWSVWGDGLAVGDNYYSAIGDHLAPAGNAFVYCYDSTQKELTQIVDVRKTIHMPADHYTPGKIHSQLSLGRDGYLYFSTHRGSTRTTTDANYYRGDWILRHHLESGKTEVVAHAPLAKQCMPTGMLDPDRLIFYAGTADGDYKNKRVMFLAYSVPERRVLYSDDHGPYRAAIFAQSTGKLYFSPEGERGDVAPLAAFDPDNPAKPKQTIAKVGLRACTAESPNHIVYTVDGDNIWRFNTATEQAESLGPTAVASQTYIASIDYDPSNFRYLYYIPGAHGGSHNDGSPLVQYDTETRQRKVICFLQPACHQQTGFVPMGTYSLAVSPDGSKVFVTWNGNSGTEPGELAKTKIKFNTCALSIIHIPASERQAN